MQIIRRSAFISVPWKNGGGITHEALRVPADVDPYRWRVSIAEIGAAGPFSSFPDYHRTMALLAGNGARLTFADGRQCVVHEIGDLVNFDGAVPVECELIAGPCTDLNLIVSKLIAKVASSVESPRAPRSIVSASGQTVLVFAVRGPFCLIDEGDSSTVVLYPWDLAVLAPGDSITLSTHGANVAKAPMVFIATLADTC